MTPEPSPSNEQRYAAFRHGAFLRFWTARFLTTFATQIVSVAVGWQVYDLTRDPFDLGLAALIGTVPAVVFGGVGAIAVAGLWAVVFPDLRRISHLRGREAREAL